MKRSMLRLVAVIATGLLVGGGLAFANRSALRSAYETFFSSEFSGPSVGKVEFAINTGDDGETIIRSLVAKGVLKNFASSYKKVVAKNPIFYPGTYRLQLNMTTEDVLAVLSDANNAVVNRVTIKEGLRIGVVLTQLSVATGLPRSDFESASKQLSTLGIPISEPSADGYLFPATYSFDPALSASDVLKSMVARTYQELDSFKVPVNSRHRVLTLASVIQKEARLTADFYKVSAVFTNRLKIGMPLQSDATVSYGSGGSTVTTTDAERADPNGYNTYVHLGLPIGAIGAPGSTAIDAALHPAKGSWLYFCAVNLATGETVFSNTIAEHDQAVQIFRRWIQENPGWNG